MSREIGNRHHVLFTRKLWCAQKPTTKLRQEQMLIPHLDVDAHVELHRQLATVPVIDHFMADRVLKDFEPVQGDYLATLDNLMFAIEASRHHENTRIIERGLGELAIAALELQKPYIREGLICPE